MPKPLFDEDSEEEVSLKTENEYAKKYDAWRQKEELHKLEQKYGTKALNPDGSLSSDSEDESDEPPEVSEETETQFLKTIALLKTKDPRIYDPNYKFFETEKKEAENKLETKTLSFADSDDDDDDDGNIFKVEKAAEVKSTEKLETPEAKTEKLKDFLTGKAKHINNVVEKDLAPLKALWSDPKLNEGEAFLRDYILNKKYLEEGDAGEAVDKIRDDEDLEADEALVEEQGKFERAYNFRFEEPDEEYLKRFPRTMNSVRPKDDRRARKRAEVRTRKEEEKKKKMDEIARMKALKLKEIQDKIAKIKEVTGNEDLAFREEDMESDFDPNEHDKRMKEIFDEAYYGEVDSEKPVFPDLDEELEIENWDKYEETNTEPHCEDDEFNMDADYDPKQAKLNLLEELQSNMTKKRRNRKKKSKLAELLTTEKPKFVPTVADKTYSEYMEEYYKMDCEDVIGGDLPTRFKYREVVPNDYGLTIEEILLADDKELTQWVPLKKIVKHQPANVEKGEVKMYQQKAADARLKKKVLPSLFKDLPEEPEIVVPIETAKKKKKKKKKTKSTDENNVNNDSAVNNEPDAHEVSDQNAMDDKLSKKKKKHKNTEGNTETELNFNVDSEQNAPDAQVSKKNNKMNADVVGNVDTTVESENTTKKKKKKHKKTKGDRETEPNLNVTSEQNEAAPFGQVAKKNSKMIAVNKAKDTRPNTDVVSNHIDTTVTTAKKKKKKHKAAQIDNDHVNAGNLKTNEPKQHDSNVATLNKSSDVANKAKSKKNRNVEVNTEKANLKRKLDENTSNPEPQRKKNKANVDKSHNKKDFNKFKNKNKQNNDKAKDNPYSNLSDERLKAYGLNPKKYKGFMKYKKF